MLKRIFSFFVILAVILVALPIFPLVSAETTDTLSGGVPILSIDKVVNDFEGISTTGTVTAEDKTVNIGVGVNTSTNYNTDDYSANVLNDANILAIENGVLKSTLSKSETFNFVTYITPMSVTRGNTMPSVDTTALQFHIDLTGISSVTAGTPVEVEVKVYLSTGKNSGDTAYCIPNKKFIYIPDATDENKNPEAEILTTGGGVQVSHGCVWGYAGQSGTVIVPMDAWDLDANKLDIWKLYSYTQDYRHRSYIRFETYTKKFAANDVFVVDNIYWMKKVTKTQDFELNVQDFSEITSNDLGGWGNGPVWNKGDNFAVTDGKLKLTKTCENSGRATTTFPIGRWNEKYEYFSFDFDASQMVNDTVLGTENSHIRMAYVVSATETTEYASCFFDGTFQFIWEDGTRVNGAAKSYGEKIPHGFKGKIIVPASAIHFSSEVTDGEKVKAGIEAGASCRFQVELMSLVAPQKDTSVYIDNFAYHYSADKLDENAGTDFSTLSSPLYETVTPVTEEILTVETFFKTESSKTQSIIGTKFGSASYHGKKVELSIISTGQLILTVGNVSMQVTNVALNDGSWHHLALTVDEDTSEICCYVDGVLFKTATLSELTYPEMSDYLPLTIGNDMPAESKYYTVFDGSIANLRLWSDVRTAEELNNNKMVSVGKDAEGLVAEWMLDSENFTAETTGKYPLKNFYWNIDSENALFAQYNRDAAEGEFTIIFLPDTQTIIKNYAGQVPDIFDWIIANAERLNIKAVVSLGDIIEYGTKEEDFVTLSAQYKRLQEAGIPAVATIGDHDYNSFATRDSTYYDKYFTSDMLYTNDEFKLGGYMSEDSIMNGYYYLTVDGEKYIIMNLEVQPQDETLAWANSVVENNPDCKVIVATHRYIARPDCGYVEVGYKHGNSGQQMWDKFVSKHKNITMVLCGHAESSGYYANYAEGENGNKVLQVNCDLQNTDQSYKTVGAVLIGRFKNDGSQVSFNLYSAHHNLFIDSNANDRVHELFAGVVAETVTVNGTNYETLESAISAASNGDTVILHKDITVTDTIVISKNIKIDTNDFTITDAVFDIADGMGMSIINGVYTFDVDSVIADINSNGKADSNDLVYMRQLLLSLSDEGKVYDINGDGDIDIRDLVRIKKLAGE